MAYQSVTGAADWIRVKRGVSWAEFQSFLVARGDEKPRVAYLEGTLELMSPSADHDRISRRFAEVTQAYMDYLSVTYDSAGAWLLKSKTQEAGLEPDETFIFGQRRKQRPDLAIEVVWTSGTVKKLEIYRRLRVREVWFWRKTGVSVYVLTRNGYEARVKSACLPQVEFSLLDEMLKLKHMSEVRRVLRKRLPPR